MTKDIWGSGACVEPHSTWRSWKRWLQSSA